MNLTFKEPVAILGFGVEGKYAYEFLKRHGVADITVCDEKESLELPSGVKSQLGPRAFEQLSDFATIIRSPGVRFNLDGIRDAMEAGAVVTSMTKLTLEIARDRVTAITGTNGKTTTVAITGEILKAQYGPRLIRGGNDGEPVLELAMKRPADPILLEVSSFQLYDVTVSPNISAILNITPNNHLDWHDTVEDYSAAKENILHHQRDGDWVILNANDENTAKLGRDAKGHVFWVGQRRGENWAAWEWDKLFVCHEGETEEIIEKKDLRVITHPDNLATAVAVGKLHGVPNDQIAHALREFRGVPHRLEFVGEAKGVKYYNDSSSSTPEAAQMAIGQFPADKLIVILGGSSKNADFSGLADTITEKNVRAYMIGAEGERLRDAIVEAGGGACVLARNASKDFAAVMKDVARHARPGDVVVLTPACASFDMFKNKKQRGDLFRDIIHNTP